MANRWLTFGKILKSKKGTLYIQVEKGLKITIEGELYNGQKIEKRLLEGGESIQLEKPQDEIDRMVENEIMTQEEGEFRKGKIPEFVRYTLKVPPKK